MYGLSTKCLSRNVGEMDCGVKGKLTSGQKEIAAEVRRPEE